jgi:hypothetical protein
MSTPEIARHRCSMRVHSIRHLFERHGVAITNAEFDAVVARIADGSNPSAGRARAGGSLHAVTIRGRAVYAVWNPVVGCVATFLPGGVPCELRFPKIMEAARG